MKVLAIHTRTGEEEDVRAVETIRAFAGKGLESDRYFFPDGAKPGLALTLVEAEVVTDIGLEVGQTRRQLTVSGMGLNDLIGKRFRVGEVECYGVELCEPCSHLEQLTRPGIMRDLVHRAGINADILTGGTIAVGDSVVPA